MQHSTNPLSTPIQSSTCNSPFLVAGVYLNTFRDIVCYVQHNSKSGGYDYEILATKSPHYCVGDTGYFIVGSIMFNSLQLLAQLDNMPSIETHPELFI